MFMRWDGGSRVVDRPATAGSSFESNDIPLLPDSSLRSIKLTQADVALLRLCYYTLQTLLDMLAWRVCF